MSKLSVFLHKVFDPNAEGEPAIVTYVNQAAQLAMLLATLYKAAEAGFNVQHHINAVGALLENTQPPAPLQALAEGNPPAASTVNAIEKVEQTG